MDESRPARAAVLVAKALAGALERQLMLVHAAATPIAFGVAAMPHAYPLRSDNEVAERAGEKLLARLAHDFGLAASVERRVEAGDPSRVLPAVAEDEAAGLIVIGSSRRSWLAKALVPGVLTAVTARAPCPVVAVPTEGRLGPGALVCAVDDSAEARAALRVAEHLAAGLGVDLVVAHVAATAPVPNASTVPGGRDELDDADRRRAEEFLAGLTFEQGLEGDVEQRVGFGSKAEAIAELADDEDAALVVIGSRGRGSFRSLLAGSVSFELTTTSARPIVVVPHGARVPP